MNARTPQAALTLRVDLLSAMVQSLARELAPAQAGRCAAALHARAGELLAAHDQLPDDDDVGVSAELAALLHALGQMPAT